MRRPCLIGIGGPSGSGKSTLAARLGAELPGGGVIVSLDSYYRPLDHLTASERAQTNFDHPDALDWDLFLAQLSTLRNGESIEEPVYRFDLHTRDPQTRAIRPGSFVIVEGILALHREAVRAMFDLKIYIETADQECYRRRLERDTRERGRTGESVAEQYRATVRPMAESFVWPTRRFADLLVSGERGCDEPVSEALDFLGFQKSPAT